MEWGGEGVGMEKEWSCGFFAKGSFESEVLVTLV